MIVSNSVKFSEITIDLDDIKVTFLVLMRDIQQKKNILRRMADEAKCTKAMTFSVPSSISFESIPNRLTTPYIVYTKIVHYLSINPYI